MSQKDPVVIFYNGKESFEKLIEKLIYRKLKKIRIEDNVTNEIMYNKDTHNRHSPKNS